MRKLVVGTFLTLDGVMQAPGGPDEDRSGGFRHGGWLVPYFDETLVDVMTDWVERAEDFWRDYRAMRSKGIRFAREPKEADYGTVAVFEDLYGNLWDLVELEHRVQPKFFRPTGDAGG